MPQRQDFARTALAGRRQGGRARGRQGRHHCEDGEAEAAIDGMMVGHQFGHAGDSVVMEEFLDGEEL